MLVLSARPDSHVTVFGLAGGTIYVYRDQNDQVKMGFCFPDHVKIQRDRVSYKEFDEMLNKYKLNRESKKGENKT